MTATHLFFFLLVSAMCTDLAAGQITETKLAASDGVSYAYFGESVSISGDYMIVGACGDNDNGTNSGSAYIYHFDGTGWVEEAKLLASDGVPVDLFGSSVSISGDLALVGAPYEDHNDFNDGSAYVFRREETIWIEEAKLNASDGAFFDYFGSSVSISGDYALVGAPFDDDYGSSSGSAYVFHREGTTWLEEAKLTNERSLPEDYFGQDVSISGDYALVGAPWNDDNGPAAGAAYVFRREGTNWLASRPLLASDGAATDLFGGAVSLSGDYALIGAYYDDDNGDKSGSAYIFRREETTWVEEAKLLAGDGAADDNFGRSVSVSSDFALVGAYEIAVNGTKPGSAYLFRREGTDWVEKAKLIASDGAVDDKFGRAVSLSGDDALVGAHWDNDNGTRSGSAYLYSGLSSSVAVSVTSSITPPSGDGAFDQVIQLTNHTSSPQTVDVWTEAFGPDGVHKVGAVIYSKTLLRSASHSASVARELGANAPEGNYSIVAYVRTYPNDVIHQSDATYTKTLIGKGSRTEGGVVPDAFELSENYPNPFNPTTTIRYGLPERTHVRLEIFNPLGQRAAILVDAEKEAGYHSSVLEGQGLASGLYFYRLQAGDFVETRKLIILR